MYTRLQKLNVSMSYQTIIRLVTEVGEGHDSVVKLWRDHFASGLSCTQVSEFYTWHSKIDCMHGLNIGKGSIATKTVCIK